MADHWRAPRDMRPGYIRFVPIACGAIVGPLVAILFVLAVIWIASASHAQSLTGADATGNIAVTTVNSGCALASLEYGTNKATIDWTCVDKSARGELGEYNRQIAAILKAAREAGKADR